MTGLVECWWISRKLLISVGSPGVQPVPSYNGGDSALLGLAFDKVSPYNYAANCNTIRGSFDSPAECCWHDCYPTDSGKHNTNNL